MIRTKFLRGLGSLLLLSLVLLAVWGSQVTSIDRIGSAMNGNFEIASISHQMNVAVKDKGIRLRNMVIFEDPGLVREQIDLAGRIHESINGYIEQLEAADLDRDQQLIVNDLLELNDEYSSYSQQVVAYVEAGNLTEAGQLIRNTGFPLQDEIDKASSKLSFSVESAMEDTFFTEVSNIRAVIMSGSIFFLLGVIAASLYLYRNVWQVAGRLKTMSLVMRKIASGTEDLHTKIERTYGDELDDVAESFNHMTTSLEEQMVKEAALSEAHRDQAWIQSHIAQITTDLNAQSEPDAIAQVFLSQVVPAIGASQAAIYLQETDEASDRPYLNLLSAYAMPVGGDGDGLRAARYRLGEGLIGQAALEKTAIHLSNVPGDYLRIQSSLGEAAPLQLYVFPVVYHKELIAVVELASFVQFDTNQAALLRQLVDNLGIILDNARSRLRLSKLLEETQLLMEELQSQSEELQSQQEELRSTNEELEAQTISLKQSEEKLQSQQEELEQANDELRDKAAMLEIQNDRLETVNREVEQARSDLEEKAAQLALSSKYKSEFLANMSHELRTPLNSLLILSNLLADNVEGNLTDKQVAFSKTIHSSGSDLLAKINEMLDLVKIEAGKMDVHISPIVVEELAQTMERSFRHIADEKRIAFEIKLAENLPPTLNSDGQRIHQILNNLLSNAFKFTSRGKVTLEIGSAGEADTPRIRFKVVDTGIGIAADKHDLIFQAFQQADGTTSRRFGGTGLGLSICRELSSLLGGELTVESSEGIGSTFSFVVGDYDDDSLHSAGEPARSEAAADAERMDRVTEGLEPKPESERLSRPPARPPQPKSNPKPPGPKSDRGIKRLLIVDPIMQDRNSLMELIGDRNVIIAAVSSPEEAWEELKVNAYDCIVLDPGLSGSAALALPEKIMSSEHGESMALFIHTSRMLNAKEEMQLRKFARAIVIKDSLSGQRLLEELDLYLKAGSDSPEQGQGRVILPNNLQHDLLQGRTVLLVDDDVRNVFALSNVLELYGMNVIFAENGLEGVKLVQENPDIDLVLMDIMMPEMDGYEAMRQIRSIPQFERLPIIALTAKAMKEDRGLCIEAGASDYIVKPVEAEQLISIIRVWLYPDPANRR